MPRRRLALAVRTAKANGALAALRPLNPYGWSKNLFDRAVALTPHIVRLRPAPHTRTPVHRYSLQVEPGEQSEQCRLAGTGRTDDGNGFAGVNAETDLGKNGQTTLRTANLFADVMGRQDGAIG